MGRIFKKPLSVCPCCETDYDICKIAQEHDYDTIEITYSCTICDAEWTETYEYVQGEILNEGRDDAF